MRAMIERCPVCDAVGLRIAKLQCVQCGTTVEGSFGGSLLAALSTEQQQFVEIFLRCRGNIRDVERELGVSYPTVRSRLEKVIGALDRSLDEKSRRRREVLAALDRREISPDEAVEALQGIS